MDPKRCRTCKRLLSSNDERGSPFCSERCRAADLGAWLQGDYRLPAEPSFGDHDGDDAGEDFSA